MNNRELKFRVWITDSKQMVYSFRINSQTGKFISFGNDEKWSDQWQIMQYTGLLDKNENAIYEGDIIETHILDNFIEDLSEFKYILMVYWDNLHSQWWAKDTNIDPYMCQRFPFYGGQYEILLEKTEIVGNIFENKDLLKSSILEN